MTALLTFTEYRVVGIRRELRRSSSPTPLPKQVHIEQAAQDPVQASFEYIQRRRLHNLSGQPVLVLCHSHNQEVLPHIQMQFLLFQFVPIAPCPVAGHHRKEFGPILLTPALKIFLSI